MNGNADEQLRVNAASNTHDTVTSVAQHATRLSPYHYPYLDGV
jgi:hypothetical protein